MIAQGSALEVRLESNQEGSGGRGEAEQHLDGAEDRCRAGGERSQVHLGTRKGSWLNQGGGCGQEAAGGGSRP